MSGTKRGVIGRRDPSSDELNRLTQLFQQGNNAQAESLANSLTRRFPKHGYGWKVLGVIYQVQRRYEESLQSTRMAITLLPRDAAVHNNLGTAQLGLGRLEDAEKSIRKALAIAPDYAKALNNLGTLLRLQGRLQEAEENCRRAVTIEPHYTAAHISLGNSLELQNKTADAIASYRAALSLAPDAASLHSDMLHLSCHDVQCDPVQLKTDHFAFGEQFEPSLRAMWNAHANTKDPARLLQVGFVSSDLYNHALSNYLEPLFKGLTGRSNLSLHLYYTNTFEDAVTLRLRQYFSNWHAVAKLSDEELANKIRSDHIDILIDLNGHTVLNRLLAFARRPAPVQASWLGYLGTSGLRAIDYFVCDPYWISPGEFDWQFTEKLVYLPSAVVFLPNPHSPPVNTLPALKNGHITFGSFNRRNKINDSVIALWSMLLRAAPDSRMVLGAISPEHQSAFIDRFENEGITQDRLTFLARAAQRDYLAFHHQVDFCLDTFPFGGGATTAHAAWMGVPTLCLAGDSPSSRFGAAETHHLGLDQFIAHSIEDFVEKGRYWSDHHSELACIRNELRERFTSSALGQTKRFADHFETMLRTIWRNWCDDLPPASFEVEETNDPATSARPGAMEPPSIDLERLSALHDQQRHQEAEPLARQLIRDFPEHGLAWKILGSVLRELGHLDQSLEIHRRTATLRPDDHEAHFNLACELQQQGQMDDAVNSYIHALGLQPNNPIVYNNLGNIFKTMGLFPEGEMYCRQAIALQPAMETAHNNLGNALHAQGKYAEAQMSYQQALVLKPNWADAYNNLAITLKDRGYAAEARDAYRTALKLKPEWAAAHSNLLYCLSLDVHLDPTALHAEHLAFGEKFERPFRTNWQPHSNVKDVNRPLNIGFVSGDLYDHALANFLEPLFAGLARQPGLAIHAYYTHIYDDATTQRMRVCFARWRSVSNLTDSELANQIRADGIDILVDLSGHTAHNRLLTFARKPAPIQASWLGYLGTTGLQAIDYYLCDKFWVLPGELDWQLTEKPAYLPSAVVFQPSPLSPPVNTLPALENGYITFGSFNRPNKLNPSVIVLWSMLLRGVPSARMVMGGVPLESQTELLRSFAREGIEHGRLTFFPRSNLPGYLALHYQVDFCLDTFPYGGGATNAHAAWMGVPTLCLAGDSPASRFGATEMHILGLDEFIATSIEDYLAKARYWAENLEKLAAIRIGMRDRFNASPLGQPERFADNFAAMLRTMWRQWCAGLPPAQIEVNEPPEKSQRCRPLISFDPTETQLEALADLYRRKRYAEAECMAQILIEAFPEHGFSWKILGYVYQAQERYEDSLPPLRRALELDAGDATVYNNLGVALSALDRHFEAEAHFRHSIAIAPDYGKSFVNLGMVLRLLGRLQESETICRRAVEIDSRDSSAHIQLGNALEDQGKSSEAQVCYYRADMAQEPRRSVAHSNVLYLLNHDVLVEPEHLFAEHQAFGNKFEAPLRAAWQPHANIKIPARRLNIGFVSGDLCHHALADFLEPTFKFLADIKTLSLHAYHTSTLEDAVTQSMRTNFRQWRAVADLSDVDLATCIRSDEIDILIDLSGHTAKNRLLTFSHKPAPIQASWLGYLGTTGLQSMDYYLCDQFWIPHGELDWQFTEKLAYLPSAVTFQPSPLSPLVSTLPTLENGFITFGSFNRANKINEAVIALWAILMRSVPTSRLLIGALPADALAVLVKSFEREGVVRSRLIFSPRAHKAEYLHLHHQVDFCLDTYPHSGGATTAHAAWMGVPTLCLAGDTPASRFGATLMHHLSLDGFIATSIEDFVARGVYWAENKAKLSGIRMGMREAFMASRIGQPEKFARDFDAILRVMWHRWCSDTEPTPCAVRDGGPSDVIHLTSTRGESN